MNQPAKIAFITLVAILAAACDGGRSDPPNSSVLVVHADPLLGNVTFRRVRANATLLQYKASAVFSFDVDTYTFNFEIAAPDESITQTISTIQTIEEDTSYAVVLRNSGGQPTTQVIATPARGASATGTQIQLLHAASVVGTVDVYFDLEGFDLATATPQATLSEGQVMPPTVVQAGSYEFALTEANNPANVLLRSTPFSISGAQDVFLFIADGANEGLAPFSIALADASAGGDFVDAATQSGLSVLNAVANRSAIDAGLDMQLAPPLISNVAFGTVTDPVLIDAGTYAFNVTQAGNTGTIETDQSFTAVRGTIGTWFVSGSLGSLTANFLEEDFRVLPGEAKLRVFDASPLNAAVEIFILPPGTNLTDQTPNDILGNGNVTLAYRFLAGDYELTVRDASTKTVLSGPTAMTLAADGYYGVLLSDPLGGSGIDVTLLYDFAAP